MDASSAAGTSLAWEGTAPAIPPALLERAARAADWLREQHAAGRRVTVVHHIDADGVSAGAVALEALARAGIAHDSVAAKSLDDVHIDKVRSGGHAALWFCDFGSTAYMHFDVPRLVCDHHELVRDGTEESFPHVNPLLDGISGSSVSGAGCTYLVAHALDEANSDLLPMALVGATGDLQDRGGGFTGTNAALLAQGLEAGLLEARQDVCWFGPETRPLWKYLTYAEEPAIPGITGDRRAVFSLLRNLQISDRGSGGERAWSDLREDERRRLRDTLLVRIPDAELDGATRWVVRLVQEKRCTPVRELQEFATLLNSTARYGQPQLGLAVARGDREHAYRLALESRDNHRQNLAKSVRALQAKGIVRRQAIQCVHAEDDVMETVVGIVCGMLLGKADADVPLIGLAYTEDGRTKVSGRAPRGIQERIDLATAMREAAAAVGGAGGGHKGAAGATIPRESEEAFLTRLEAIVAAQLGIPMVSDARATGRRTPAAGAGGVLWERQGTGDEGPGTLLAQRGTAAARTADPAPAARASREAQEWKPVGSGQTRLA